MQIICMLAWPKIRGYAAFGCTFIKKHPVFVSVGPGCWRTQYGHGKVMDRRCCLRSMGLGNYWFDAFSCKSTISLISCQFTSFQHKMLVTGDADHTKQNSGLRVWDYLKLMTDNHSSPIPIHATEHVSQALQLLTLYPSWHTDTLSPSEHCASVAPASIESAMQSTHAA